MKNDMKRVVLSSLFFLFSCTTLPMHVPAQPEHHVLPLKQLAAAVLVKRRWYQWQSPGHTLLKQPLDIRSKSAIIEAGKCNQDGYNLLLLSLVTLSELHPFDAFIIPNANELLQLVADHMITYVKKYPWLVYTRKNLSQAVLPKITTASIGQEKVEHVLRALTVKLLQSPEFRRVEEVHYPHGELDDVQLNLEQTIYLLSLLPNINTSKLSAYIVLNHPCLLAIARELRSAFRTKFIGLYDDCVTNMLFPLYCALLFVTGLAAGRVLGMFKDDPHVVKRRSSLVGLLPVIIMLIYHERIVTFAVQYIVNRKARQL